MMPFFNRTGLERIGVVGPEIKLLLVWSVGSRCGATNLQSLNMALLYKDKKKKGSGGGGGGGGGGGFTRSRSNA